MDLRETESLWLSTRTPRELIALIRAQTEWDSAAAANLDGGITALVSAVLARQNPDLDDLEEHQSLLRAATRRLPADLADHAACLARWAGLADILHIRANLLNHGSYDAIRHLRHADAIIAAIRAAGKDGLLQSEIQQQLGLQPANLTRILNLLEDHRVVVRERSGKEKRVRLGVNAPPDKAIKGGTRVWALSVQTDGLKEAA